MEWTIVYFSNAVQELILELPPGVLARFVHLTERIQTFGPNLGKPHTGAMGDGLFEMRMKSQEGIGRVFYCTLPGRRVMVLHSIIKKSEKTPKNDLRTARARLNEVRRDANA